MKKTTKRGFTIVELVIVIAVIAILAAVLIPTFSGVLGDAKDSAAESGARNAYTQYLIDNKESEAELADDFIYVADGRYVLIADGNVGDAVAGDLDDAGDALAGETHTIATTAVSGVEGLYTYVLTAK